MDISHSSADADPKNARPAASAASSSKSWLWRPRSAAQFLLAFALALMAPTLVLAVLLARQYIGSERDRAIEAIRSSAREALIAVERDMAGPQVALEVLASAPALRDGDLRTFYSRAKNAAEALGGTIVVRSAGDGAQLLNTSVAWGDTLPESIADFGSFDSLATHDRKTVLTGVLGVAGNSAAAVAMLTPVFKDEEPRYILSLEIPTSHYVDILRQISLPPGWISAVVDNRGATIAQSSGQGNAVDTQLSPEWFAFAKRSGDIWVGRGLDGHMTISGHTRSANIGWIAAVAVSEEVLNAPVWRTAWLLLVFGLGLLLMASLLALLFGMRLASAIGSLKLAGLQYSDHRLSSRIDTPVKEINEVGAALAEAISQSDRREAQLNSILATVPNAMVIIDTMGIILAFSKSAEKMFGYSAEEVRGQNVRVLMPEPDRSAHDRYIEQYKRTGERKVIGIGRMVTGFRKDGTRFPVELHVGEANIEGERLFTGFLQDLTEKQRIEQELHQTQKMEAIGKLTGGVAHDFNNLLTVIKGNLEMLEDFIDEEQQDMLRDSQEAADLAAQLTTSLLAFGRRMPLNPQRLNVAELLASTSDLLRRTLGETIEVSTSIEKVSDVIVDGAQLQNAILNLAINARDAMPRGGTLSIALSEVELDDDYIAVYGDVRPGHYVMIAVTDTGTGMTPEVRDRAFEPFFTTKPQGSGTGLGLSSVYGFVKQSEGHIALYSEKGQGTTVRIYLPCLRNGAQPAQSSQTAKEVLPRGAGRVVLVAEDDNLVRRVTVARLRTLGYAVLEAGDGPSALALLEERQDIALLFTDMVMPGGMTGADLANLARTIKPELKILFTSGYAEPDLVREADSMSGTWLKKPYTAAELARRVDSLLNA
jgi:PAS domain S-box-containing protein